MSPQFLLQQICFIVLVLKIPSRNQNSTKNIIESGEFKRTYRFYTGKAVVPFGFGLSYTSFTYTLAHLPKSAVSLAALRELLETHKSEPFPRASRLHSAMSRNSWQEQTQYAVKVTNTGDKDADDTVLGFLIPPDAGKDGIPLKILFGFQRVHVKAGATETVWLYPNMLDFAIVGREGHFKLHPGEYRVHFGLPETVPFGMGFVEEKNNVSIWGT